VTVSGTPGVLLHTATNTAGEKDEVWLWGTNNTNDTASLIIEWAGTDGNTDISQVGIPAAQGRQLLIAGETLGGGLNIRAFSTFPSAVVSGVNIGGHVNRIS
jgi:hypothetical protein